jgi:hypothetical protein
MGTRVAALTAAAAFVVILLAELTTTLNKGKHLTCDAQYTSVNGGRKETITVAHAPSKSSRRRAAGP